MKNKFQKCSMISRDNFGVNILFIPYTVGSIEGLKPASELYDARSEGAPIFRQKKFGFFVQWSFERGSSVFSNLSYIRETYRFYKLKLQKEMILSDFIFENYPL